jgi:hypothetical protein
LVKYFLFKKKRNLSILFFVFSLGTDPKKHACYDIDVEVDDPVRESMRTFLSPQNTHELEELDGKVRITFLQKNDDLICLL